MHTLQKTNLLNVETPCFGREHAFLFSFTALLLLFTATRWFIAGFATSLPMGTVLRIWDVFFCEGIKVFHRIGLGILKV